MEWRSVLVTYSIHTPPLPQKSLFAFWYTYVATHVLAFHGHGVSCMLCTTWTHSAIMSKKSTSATTTTTAAHSKSYEVKVTLERIAHVSTFCLVQTCTCTYVLCRGTYVMYLSIYVDRSIEQSKVREEEEEAVVVIDDDAALSSPSLPKHDIAAKNFSLHQSASTTNKYYILTWSLLSGLSVLLQGAATTRII